MQINETLSLTEKLVKGGSVIVFFSIFSSIFGYLIKIIYSQSLSVEMYGLFFTVQNMFLALGVFDGLGFGSSVSYFLPKYFAAKDYPTCIKLFRYDQLAEVGTSVFISILVVLMAPWLTEHYFKIPEAQNVIYIFATYVFANGFLNAANNCFNGLQKERYYSSIQFTRFLIALIFSSIFLFLGFHQITYYAATWSIASLATGAIYNFLLYKQSIFLVKPSVYFDRNIFHEMYSYALPTLLTSITLFFTIFGSTFFLTLFHSVVEVGIYNIALPLASISVLLFYPINVLITPLTSGLMEKDKNQVEHLLQIIYKFVPFLSLYFALFIVLFPSTPVKLLFGEKWIGLVEDPLVILSLGYVISLISFYQTSIISGMGKVKERFRAVVIITIASTLLNALLIYKLGVLGAALANSLVFIISVILYGRIIRQVVNIKYPYGYYLKLLVFSLAIFLLVRLFHFYPYNWFQYLATGAIYTVLMAILGYYLHLYDISMLKLALKK